MMDVLVVGYAGIPEFFVSVADGLILSVAGGEVEGRHSPIEEVVHGEFLQRSHVTECLFTHQLLLDYLFDPFDGRLIPLVFLEFPPLFGLLPLLQISHKFFVFLLQFTVYFVHLFQLSPQMCVFPFQSLHFPADSFHVCSKMGLQLLQRVVDAIGHELMCEFELSDFCCDLFGIFVPPGCSFLRVVVDDGILEYSVVVVLYCHYVGSILLAEAWLLELFDLFQQESLEIGEAGRVVDGAQTGRRGDGLGLLGEVHCLSLSTIIKMAPTNIIKTALLIQRQAKL